MPVWRNDQHAELVRVRPEFAKSVSQIMDRFAMGVSDVNRFNGNSDLTTDTPLLSPEVRDQLYEIDDLMGANVIDRNDVVQIAERVMERNTARSRKSVSSSKQDDQVSEETLTE